MRARRRQHWAVWLLPFFVLRAFVPAGFMWAPPGSGIGLVPCPIFAAAPAADPDNQGVHGAHAHHAGAHAGGAPDATHAFSLCPFAASGCAFLNSCAPAALPAPTALVLFVAPPRAAVHASANPAFDHTIRGPPALA